MDIQRGGLDGVGIDGLGFVSTGKPQFAKFNDQSVNLGIIQKNWEQNSVLGVWGVHKEQKSSGKPSAKFWGVSQKNLG